VLILVIGRLLRHPRLPARLRAQIEADLYWALAWVHADLPRRRRDRPRRPLDLVRPSRRLGPCLPLGRGRV